MAGVIANQQKSSRAVWIHRLERRRVVGPEQRRARGLKRMN
jgi:hypothetical protein